MKFSHWSLTAFLSLYSASAADGIELLPGFRLDLRPILETTFPYPVSIGSFVASSKSLYFLVNPQTASIGKQAILEMDLGGKVTRVVPLAIDVDFRWLQYDEDSRDLLVWKRARSTQPNVTEAVYKVGVNGEVTEEAVFAQRLRYPAKLGDAVWGITSSGCIRQVPNDETRICNIGTADPFETGLMYKPFSSTELVSIEPITAALIKLNPHSGGIVTRRIVAPEVQSALDKSSNSTTAVIINDLVVASPQYVLVNVMRQPFDKGAAILQLDLNGDTVGRFRCQLTREKAFQNAGNPNGYMFPSLIGFANSTLFIVDRSGMLASCQLALGSIPSIGKSE